MQIAWFWYSSANPRGNTMQPAAVGSIASKEEGTLSYTVRSGSGGR
jgi:hypothetical protein